MSSGKTPPPEGGHVIGCDCSCEIPSSQPDSTTHRPDVWDAEAIEALGHYHDYILESLKDNFNKVMTLACQAAVVEQENSLGNERSQTDRRQQRRRQ